MNATAPGAPAAELALLAAELHTAFVAKCLATAALALTLYEYVLTLSNEVALFWNTKLSSASVLLFFHVRLILLAIAATTIAGNYVPEAIVTLTGCKSYNIWNATLTMLGYTMIAVISAIRVFAVTGRNWPLSLLTLTLGLLPVVINIYLLTTAYYLVEPVPTTTVCAVMSTISPHSANKVALASRLGVILSDTLVVAATWFNLFQSAKFSAKSGFLTSSVSWHLLRDGTLYFSVILVLNLIDILLWWFDRIQFFTSLIFPLSLILLSRLLMSLRQVAYSDAALRSQSTSARTTGTDLPTQMSDVFFVPRTVSGMDTDDSPPLETFEDEEDVEMAEVAIIGEDDSRVDVGSLEANAVK